MISQTSREHPHHHPENGHGHAGRCDCAPVPEFKRIKYFYGQMLGAADFQSEQDYFREKLKLHNRCLHGYGTVCGMEVVPEPMDVDCDPPPVSERTKIEQEIEKLKQELSSSAADEAKRKEIQQKIDELERKLKCMPPADDCRPAPRTRVHVLCGLAYDCEGNEIVVRRDFPVDLLGALSPQDRKRAHDGTVTFYMSICYCEQPIDPVRPVLPDSCGAAPDCTFGKLRDSFRVRVTIDEPAADSRCEPCCAPCPDDCLLLARIDCFEPGKPLSRDQIHNEVRRHIGPYVLTRISGVSWTHGATYTIDEAAALLGTRDEKAGLEIRFSRPILTSTIQNGIVDLWVIEGGRGRAGNIYSMEGEYIGLPSTRTTDRLRYRQKSRESLQAGDRLLITVRAAFLLDVCCYAVDGENIGGRVPLLADYRQFAKDPQILECHSPPNGFGPWLSGNGSQAGTFESWIYITDSYGKDPGSKRMEAQS